MCVYTLEGCGRENTTGMIKEPGVRGVRGVSGVVIYGGPSAQRSITTADLIDLIYPLLDARLEC